LLISIKDPVRAILVQTIVPFLAYLPQKMIEKNDAHITNEIVALLK